MGVDFRGKGYVRRVRIGKRTVKEGEAVAVWDQYGRHRQVDGPALLRLWWSHIRFLDRHIAGAEEYLRVETRDGKVTHLKGPVSLFENPVLHNSVKVLKAVAADSLRSYIVVHRGLQEGRTEGSNYTIIEGPVLFFPEPSDRVHVFSWAKASAGVLAQTGQVLHLNVPAIRTLSFTVRDGKDHAATIGLQAQIRLSSVKAAVEIADPLAACDAIIESLVVKSVATVLFGSSVDQGVRPVLMAKTFEDSLAEALRQKALCDFVSLTIQSLSPSADLQNLLRKEDELAEAKVSEQLAAMALDAAVERQGREHALARSKQSHEIQLAAEQEAAARANDEYFDQRRLVFFKELKNLGVDMTKYLCTIGDPHHMTTNRTGSSSVRL